MRHSHTLTRHKDIQTWVIDHNGSPAMARVADRFGQMSPRLSIQFKSRPRPSQAPSLDDGVSPLSWTAWLAELDRQHLALRVSGETEYELVSRQDLN
jgi:hypothetical protein